ncbi:MAG: SCO family protein [Spirochaetales bacterium]|nr:SCO family protein [Spirochaetales bacterium]
MLITDILKPGTAFLSVILLFISCKKESPEHCDQPVQASSTADVGWDFNLLSHDGPFDSRTLRGQTVLIYFGFTSCPDVCPATMAQVSRALRSLPEKEQAATQLLFISVDPDRDTPERLRSYTAHFHPRIRPLWGSEADLQRVAALFGARFSREPIDSAMKYTMDHTPDLFVLNKNGQLVDMIPHGTDADDIVKLLMIHLKDTNKNKG